MGMIIWKGGVIADGMVSVFFFQFGSECKNRGEVVGIKWKRVVRMKKGYGEEVNVFLERKWKNKEDGVSFMEIDDDVLFKKIYAGVVYGYYISADSEEVGMILFR